MATTSGHPVAGCALHTALLGRFDEALGSIRTALEDTAHTHTATTRVELLRARARVLTLRGYPQAARASLREAQHGQADVTPATRRALDVHCLFVQVVGCGEGISSAACPAGVEEEMENAPGVEEEMENAPGRADSDDDLVEMYSHICRVKIVQGMLCGRRNGYDSGRQCKTLLRLLNVAIRERHWGRVHMLSIPYCSTAATRVAIAWLRSILSHGHLPHAYRGFHIMQLLDLLVANSEFESLEHCLNQAEETYRSCNHALGLHEVRRYRLDHGLTIVPDPLKETLTILHDYMAADYPFGVLRASLSPLTLLLKIGNYRGYVQVHEVFHSICKLAGLQHERILLEFQILAVLNAGTGNHGRVTELGRAIYTECTILGYWTIACHVGKVLSLAQFQAGAVSDATALAEKVCEIAQRENLALAGDAMYHIAMVRASIPASDLSTLVKQRETIIETLLPGLDKDVEEGQQELVCQKLQLIAQLRLELGNKTVDHRWYAEMFVAIDASRSIAASLPRAQALDANGNCDDLMVTHLLAQGRRLSGTAKEDEAIQICHQLIDAYQQEGQPFRVAMKRMMRALCQQQMYQKESDVLRRLAYLEGAEQSYADACGELEQAGYLRQLLVARHGRARVHREAWVFFR